MKTGCILHIQVPKVIPAFFRGENKKAKSDNTTGKFTKNFEEKIDKITNKNIRNSLSQLLKTVKNA